MSDQKYIAEENIRKAFDNHEAAFDEQAFSKFQAQLDNVPPPSTPGTNWYTAFKSKFFFVAIAGLISAVVVISLTSDSANPLSIQMGGSASEVSEVVDTKQVEETNTNTVNKINIDSNIDKEAISSAEVTQTERNINTSENTPANVSVDNSGVSADQYNETSLTNADAKNIDLKQSTQVTNTSGNQSAITGAIEEQGESNQERSSDVNRDKTNTGVAASSSNEKQNIVDESIQKDRINDSAAVINDTQAKNIIQPRDDENETFTPIANTLGNQANQYAPALSLESIASVELSNFLSTDSEAFKESLLDRFVEADITPVHRIGVAKHRSYLYLKAGAVIADDRYDFGAKEYFIQNNGNYQPAFNVNLGLQFHKNFAAEFGFMSRTIYQSWKIDNNFHEAGKGIGYNQYKAIYLSARVVGAFNIYRDRFFVTPHFGYVLTNPDVELGNFGKGQEPSTVTNDPDGDLTLSYESELVGIRENALNMLDFGIGLEFAISTRVHVNADVGYMRGFNIVQTETYTYQLDGGVPQSFKVDSKGTISMYSLSLKYNFQ